jgi:hypothetical protein
MSTAKRIGGDWVESVDPNSGKKYYANLKTKVTSWAYPAELRYTQNVLVCMRERREEYELHVGIIPALLTLVPFHQCKQ